jgi:hypothetical protein
LEAARRLPWAMMSKLGMVGFSKKGDGELSGF